MGTNLILATLLALSVHENKLSNQKEPDVRNCAWGMTIEQVKSSEGLPVLNETREHYGRDKNGKPKYTGRMELQFETVIDGLDVILLYYFQSNSLSDLTMVIQWPSNIQKEDYSIKNRIKKLHFALKTLKNEKKYSGDNYWIKGPYYSSKYLNSNKFCIFNKEFDFTNEEHLSLLETCYKSTEWNENLFCCWTLSNSTSNLYISFPTAKMDDKTSKQVIGWFKYSAKNLKENKY